MEIRKLQTTAAGTFIVTIPKDWASQLGLKKGGLLYMDLEEGDVVISPVGSRATTLSRPLKIDGSLDRKMLELSITASYIQGHDITEVKAEGTILPEQKRWIREAVDNLVGVEISEEYSGKVVLQNLVDPLKFDLAKSMEKFSATSLAVLGDSVKALRSGDRMLAQDAYERGFQSTRLYRLLMRLAIQGVRNRKLRDEMKIYDVGEIVVKAMAIKDLGRIAYYAMRVAQHVRETEKLPDAAVLDRIEKMAKTSSEMQERAFEAFMKKDLRLASTVIDRMDEVRKMYDEIYLSSLKKERAKESLAVSLIARGIRGIAGYTVALADDAVLAVFG
ncbi:MAG: phosphate uptake regulator PhoU [Thaumarchaeota archaeon]|nr:phosphate uptake regulator PhoU [Nitrososphaerota archaeon]MDA4137195.1 phosphate uptake regulator PhoU [Nitrososphaerota archaeon]